MFTPCRSRRQNPASAISRQRWSPPYRRSTFKGRREISVSYKLMPWPTHRASCAHVIPGVHHEEIRRVNHASDAPFEECSQINVPRKVIAHLDHVPHQSHAFPSIVRSAIPASVPRRFADHAHHVTARVRLDCYPSCQRRSLVRAHKMNPSLCLVEEAPCKIPVIAHDNSRHIIELIGSMSLLNPIVAHAIMPQGKPHRHHPGKFAHHPHHASAARPTPYYDALQISTPFNHKKLPPSASDGPPTQPDAVKPLRKIVPVEQSPQPHQPHATHCNRDPIGLKYPPDFRLM